MEIHPETSAGYINAGSSSLSALIMFAIEGPEGGHYDEQTRQHADYKDPITRDPLLRVQPSFFLQSLYDHGSFISQKLPKKEANR